MGFVFFVESDLSLKEHITKLQDLGNVRHLECLCEDLEPGLVSFADLTDLLLTLLLCKIILLQIQFELELEALEDHAGGKDAWLIFREAGVERDRFADVVCNRLQVLEELHRRVSALHRCL